jgi:hypothetical protein
MSSYDTVLQVVQARVHALVQKSAGLSETEAVAKVFRNDPDLYRQYREAAGRQPARSSTAPVSRLSPTPTGAEVEALTRADRLVQKQAGLSEADALSRVFADDPQLYQRYRTGEASVEKADSGAPAATTTPMVAHPLADDLLALAKLFSPTDPSGAGMRKVRQALGLLRETVRRKTGAAA